VKEMTNGKLALTKNGDWTIVRNAGLGMKGGHEFTRQFLEAHRHLFSRVAFGSGYPEFALRNNRVSRFVAYCTAQGVGV